MGIVRRQSIKGSLATYAGLAIGYINLLYVIPSFLSPEENGLFRFVLETATFFAFLVQSGIPNAIPKFYPEFKSKDQTRALEIGAFLLPILAIGVFCIPFFLFIRDIFLGSLEEKANTFRQYEWAVLPLMASIIYFSVIENLLSVKQRVTVPKIIREIILRTGITLIIFIYGWQNLSLRDFFILLNILYGFLIILIVLYNQRINLKHSWLSRTKINLQSIPWRRLGSYLTLMAISGIGTNLVNKIDVFMITQGLGLEENAIYTTAFLISMTAEIPSRIFHQIYSPMVSGYIFNKDFRQLRWSYKKASTIQGITTLGILTLILLNLDWLFHTMPDAETYQSGYYVVVFLGVAKLFDAITGINGMILANSRYYHVGIYFTFFLAGIAILLNNFLIPQYGVFGAAVATALSVLAYNAIMLLFVFFKFHMFPFSRGTLHFFTVLILSIIPVYISRYLDFQVIGSLSISIVYMLIFGLYIIKTNASRELRSIALKVLKAIKLQ